MFPIYSCFQDSDPHNNPVAKVAFLSEALGGAKIPGTYPELLQGRVGFINDWPTGNKNNTSKESVLNQGFEGLGTLFTNVSLACLF